MEERKEQKRELILAAAMKLFLSNGYTNTKISDIAMEAGIGKGTVYEYFDSKEALFCELFRQKVIAKMKQVHDILHEEMTYAEKLKTVIRYDIDNTVKMESYRNIISYCLLESEMVGNKELMAEMHGLMETKVKLLYEIIKGGIESEEFIDVNPLMASLSIFGAINFYLSFGYDYIKPPQDLNMKKDAPWKEDEFFNLLFHGLKNDSISGSYGAKHQKRN